MHNPAQIHGAQMSATIAWRNALNLPNAPRYAIETAWDSFKARTCAASPLDHGVIAAETERVMRAFAELDPRHLDAIARAESMPHGYDAAAVQAAEHAWGTHPILAAFHAAQEAVRIEHASAMAEGARLRALQAERDAPRTLITMLRARGLTLGVSANGKALTVPPAQTSVLLATEMDALKQHKAAIIAILLAEADAAAPVVLV